MNGSGKIYGTLCSLLRVDAFVEMLLDHRHIWAKSLWSSLDVAHIYQAPGASLSHLRVFLSSSNNDNIIFIVIVIIIIIIIIMIIIIIIIIINPGGCAVELREHQPSPQDCPPAHPPHIRQQIQCVPRKLI